MPTDEVIWVVDDQAPETADAIENTGPTAALYAELILYLRDLTPPPTINTTVEKPVVQQVFLPSYHPILGATKTIPEQTKAVDYTIMETESLPWAASASADDTEEVVEVADVSASVQPIGTQSWIESVPTQMWS